VPPGVVTPVVPFSGFVTHTLVFPPPLVPPPEPLDGVGGPPLLLPPVAVVVALAVVTPVAAPLFAVALRCSATAFARRRLAKRTLFHTSRANMATNTTTHPTSTRATATVRAVWAPLPAVVTPLWKVMPANRTNMDVTSSSVSRAL
jgi:hypothetical protein